VHYERAIIYFISINMKDIKTLPLIGFIGQGFIGKNYADDMERRGYSAVRYALEEPYRANKDAIKDCDIVFIAVPTPTTPDGFDASIIEKALSLIGEGKVAVIKSTVVPGTTKRLQKMFTNIIILHSPEFLTEKTAVYDSAHPARNIIGIPIKTTLYEEHAGAVLALLPKALYELIADSNETELIKYAGNIFLYFKIIFANLFYDVACATGSDYSVVRDALAADPRIGASHLNVVDTSGHHDAVPGRGAGGHCFIKDFAALERLYGEILPNEKAGVEVFHALARKNIELLLRSKKDLDLLEGVYGKDISKTVGV